MAQLSFARTELIAENPKTGTNKRFNTAIIALPAFLLLNALKITLFNICLLQKASEGIFIYKFILTLLAVIVIYPLLYRTGSRFVLVGIYVLQALYMAVNLGYYLYFRSYLHILQTFSLFHEAFSIAGNSAVPLHAEMLVVLIDLPVFLCVLIFDYMPRQKERKLGKPVLAAMLIAVFAITSIEIVNHVQRRSVVNLVNDTFSGESPIVERYGTIVNNIVDILHNSSNSAMEKQLRYGREQSSRGVSGQAVPSGKSSASGLAASNTAPNYILIQVESMDSNIVNSKYKGNYITPFLHSLGSKSIYYPYVMSYHEGGGTSDSEFAVLNSVEPLAFYPALKLSGYEYPNSLVKQLKSENYTSLAFHGNIGTFYNRDVAFPKIGYNNFFDMMKMRLPENGWGVPDNDVFNYAFDKLGEMNGPFFAHIITMTSHEPFNNARNYYNNSLYDDISDSTVKEYYNSMSYVDKSIQEFVTKVEKSFKNTYIIIYGDHTPNISSTIFKQASFTMDGKYFEFVPMMIITPDGKVRKETKEAASFLDVAPTILKTSGIRYDFRTDGQNLSGSGLEAADLPFKGGSYNRALLYRNAAATDLSSANLQ